MEEDCPEGDIYNAAEVADLDDCIEPEHEGDMWIIPDHTPDWLYSIIELYGGCELMESVFEFDSKETIKKLAEICDKVIDDVIFEIIIYALVLLPALLAVEFWCRKERDWNKGVCPKCGGN